MQRAVIAIALGTVGLAEWIISIVSTYASCCYASHHAMHSREVSYTVKYVHCSYWPIVTKMCMHLMRVAPVEYGLNLGFFFFFFNFFSEITLFQL